MRMHYVALVAAATLIASTQGHQAARDSAKSSSLRTTAENQPGVVDGKTSRFLTSDDNFEPLAVTSTGGHTSTALQKGDGQDRQLRQLLNFDPDQEARSFFSKKKRRRKKKHKEEGSGSSETGDSSDSSDSKDNRKSGLSWNPFKW